MDFGKWRYTQQKKESKSHTSKGGKLKQLNIDTIRIGDHDLQIKINRAKGFLEEGNKVQFTLRFKGRELAHLDLGRNLFNKIKDELFPVSKVERDAKMEGKRMTLVLQPERKAPDAKAPPRPAPGQRPTPMNAGAGLNLPIGARPPGAAMGVARPAIAPAGTGIGAGSSNAPATAAPGTATPAATTGPGIRPVQASPVPTTPVAPPASAPRPAAVTAPRPATAPVKPAPVPASR